MAKEDAEEALEEAKQELVNRLTTVPRTLLQEIVDENRVTLEPSALEFLERYINGNKRNISTRDILTDLIRTYSSVVAQFRRKNRND